MPMNTGSCAKSSASFEPRQCTIDDLEWVTRLARLSYGRIITDVQKTKLWLRQAILNDTGNVFFWRTKKAAIVGVAGVPFYLTQPLASIQFFAGKEEELALLFERARFWAKGLGAQDGLHFKSSTGYDISGLVKRVRADVESPSYLLRL